MLLLVNNFSLEKMEVSHFDLNFELCHFQTNTIIHKSGLNWTEINQMICALFNLSSGQYKYWKRHFQIPAEYFGTSCGVTVQTWAFLLRYDKHKEAEQKFGYFNYIDSYLDEQYMLWKEHQDYELMSTTTVIQVDCGYELDHVFLLIKENDRWLVVDSRIKEQFYYQWITDVRSYLKKYTEYEHTEENYRNLICKIKPFDRFAIKRITVSYFSIPNPFEKIVTALDDIIEKDFEDRYQKTNHKELVMDIRKKLIDK